jgi:hypothetical protein
MSWNTATNRTSTTTNFPSSTSTATSTPSTSRLGTSTWGSGSSTFGSGFGFGRTGFNDLLVRPDTQIKDIPISDNAPQDARSGQRQIISVYNIQREYDILSRLNTPSDTSFDDQLSTLERDITRAVEQTLVGLAAEIDNGNGQIVDYRESLEAAREEAERASLVPRSTAIAPFLPHYIADLKRRKKTLRRQLEAVDLERNPMRPGEVLMIVEALKQQMTSVTSLGARVAIMQEKMRRIRDIRGERGRGRDDELDVLTSQLGQIQEKYQRFKADRRSDLAKRNTDLVRTPENQTGAFGFGTGRAGGFAFPSQRTGTGGTAATGTAWSGLGTRR